MSSQSAGRRIFSVVSIVISALVLILAVAIVIGTWAARGTIIDISTGIFGGVEQLAKAGREGVDRLDTRLATLQAGIDEVTAAVEQVAGNVEDKGLILTLLPPEKEQKLVDTAEQISDGVASVKGAIEAAVELKQAIDQIPFVNLPQPDTERVEAAEENINAIRQSVDELKTDIREFREGASTNVSKISAATSKISDRVATSQENLAQTDSRLEALQNRAGQLKARVSFYVTTVVVVITLLFGWVIYAMIMLIRQALANLRA